MPDCIRYTHAVLPQQPQSFCVLRATGRDHATFAGGDYFTWMKAEANQVAVATDLLASIPTTNRAGSVFDNRQAAGRRQCLQTTQLSRQSNLMNDQNRFRPGRDRSFGR